MGKLVISSGLNIKENGRKPGKGKHTTAQNKTMENERDIDGMKRMKSTTKKSEV